jgi:hypothetical protein
VTEGLAALGHHHLWVGGVHHNDISVKNLMYDKASGRGILNDYDLAHLNGRTRPSGAERTGTMPFMALELLSEKAWNGHVERLYRHDCESFAWVLLWICCRYDDGEEIDNPPLSKFITDTYEQCYGMKSIINSQLGDIAPTSSYEPFWEVASEFISRRVVDHHVFERQNYRKRAVNTQVTGRAPAPQRTINEEEEEPFRVFESYRKVLEEYGFNLNDLS